MLRLSSKSEYGVRAMFELAKNYDQGPITIKEIASRQGVPVAYLEQLLNKLRKSKLINSRKGPGGGYLISKKPSEISVGMILHSLEGPVALAQCLHPSTKGCEHIESCVSRLLWKSLGEKIEQFLDTTNLNDLLLEEARLTR